MRRARWPRIASSTSRAAPASATSADVLLREGVIDQPWVFVGGVFVLKAREDLKAGEYQFKAHASLRDVVATIVEGRVVTHQLTDPGRADLRADRRAPRATTTS